MTRLVPITLAVGSLVAASVSAHATLTPPPGLNPGDPYRIAFVTSDSFLTTAESIDIADYNQVATAAANSQPDLVALGTNWFALVSVPGTPPISAKENSGTDDTPDGTTGVPIFRVDGVTIADDYDDLWDRTIDAPLNVSEDGTVQDAITAWTGTLAEGTFNSNQPLGSDAFFSGRGQIGATGDLWIATFGSTNQSALNPIYVVSDVITFAPQTTLFGDYNASGLVEQGDLNLVLSNWGIDSESLGVPSGWINDPPVGVIDQAELNAVLSNWGDASISNSVGTVVPEPAVITFVSGFGVLLLRNRYVPARAGHGPPRSRPPAHGAAPPSTTLRS
ncbi:MAG: hypothetical protein AAGJ38_02015 [Planctomycetota bacterium]